MRLAEREEPTLRQGLLAGLGPEFVLDGEVPPSRLRLLAERWERWDARDGFAWRIRHNSMHQADEIEAHRRLTGHHKPETNLVAIRARFPDLRERASPSST